MNKKILQVLFVSFSVVLTINSQTIKKDSQRYDKAKAIIEQSQKAIYQNIKKENVKSLYLKTEGTSAIESVTQIEGISNPQETKSRQVTDSDISVELKDKISQKTFSYDEAKNSIENYSKIESVINGEKFSQNMETIIDGKAVDSNAMLNAPYVPESVKKQLKEAMEKNKPTKETVKKNISEQLFAILLTSLLSSDKVFAYIGKAEANDRRADILEIESDTGRQTRYFFDEKTHLLLMITDEIAKGGMSVKTTQYFSDYQVMDGLMIAKKINVETESSANQEMDFMGKNTKVSSKYKTITETTIKDFKINPAFKPETFAVKEGK